MSSSTLEIIRCSLESATQVENFNEWELKNVTAIGGAIAVGFEEKSENLLVVSSAGQSVFNCATGERAYRNREEDGYDEARLEGRRLDLLDAPVIRMSGPDGGGLLRVTSDGWTVNTLPIDWPKLYHIIEPPDASIHSLSPQLKAYGKDATYYLLKADLSEPVAFGFSWTGKSLVWCDRSDLHIWSRAQ